MVFITIFLFYFTICVWNIVDLNLYEYRKECVKSEYVTKLTDKHSVWGVGRTQPDPDRAKTLPGGLVVPLGPPVNRDITTSLLYNEYPFETYNANNTLSIVQINSIYTYNEHIQFYTWCIKRHWHQ